MAESIYPCLWFDGKAKEAAEYYCSIFKNSKILSENHMVVQFELNGKKIMGLNGGPLYKFNEAISLVLECDNQEEIDYYWNSLTQDGGKEVQCGWLKDKYGVSWQVIPKMLSELLGNPNKAESVIKAFMQMKKIIIADLL